MTEFKKNFIIIGIGPHAKRTYIRFFEKYELQPKIIIELFSNKDVVEKLILSKNWNSELFFIPDKCKDDLHLSDSIKKELEKLIFEKKITHVIIATEPKGHHMYLDFFIQKKIHILTDKPIIVFKNMLNIENIEKMKLNFYKLLNKQKKGCQCKVLCQRVNHKGYLYIKNLIKEIIVKYNIPITYISIYSCDGNWVMPHDLDYENHPYKYGYGKLFHSGFHFIDLLSEFLKLNNYASDLKKLATAEMFNSFVTPNDELGIISISDYKKIFASQKSSAFYSRNSGELSFNKYGEKDYFAQFKCRNKNGKIITMANLNILESGVSRRAWIKTKADRYKNNGRIRHESINIQIGPLLNIQVHSYQSKEVKDRTKYETAFGGIEHFDIDIYRNADLIGGKPYERITATDLYNFSDEKYFKGLNESAREDFIKNFFNNKNDLGELKQYKLSMEILYQSCMSSFENENGGKVNEKTFSLVF